MCIAADGGEEIALYFIGVDSGGTKTSFVLCDRRGRILARHRSGSGGFLSSGEHKIAAMLREGVAALCAQAGITVEGVAAAALGFPGYGEAKDSARTIDRLCEQIFGRGKAQCHCDCYLGWAGSLALQPGINIVAGTGSICFGVDDRGRAARSGGWGAYCDEGSCRWIGSRLIQTFAKQADGRMARTALYERFRTHFALDEDVHFVGPLNHELGPSGAKTAQLQVLLKELFDAGDPHAAAIYREAAQELWLAIGAVAAQLGMAGSSYRVSYSGGLFRSGPCILGPLGELVSAGGARLVAPRFAPDLGAVLLAMRSALPGLSAADVQFTELETTASW